MGAARHRQNDGDQRRSTRTGNWLDDVMFFPQGHTLWPLNVVVVRSGAPGHLVDAGSASEFPDSPKAGQGRLRPPGIDPCSRDGRGAHPPTAHGPRGRVAHRGAERTAAPHCTSHMADSGGRVLGGARFYPHRHAGTVPDALRSMASRFLDKYAAGYGRSRRSMTPGVMSNRRSHAGAQHRPASPPAAML